MSSSVPDGKSNAASPILPGIPAETLQKYARTVFETGQQLCELELEGETPAAPGVRRSWLEQWFPVRVDGVIIGVGPPPEMPQFRGELIQVGVHLRPGHSGGPLVDVQSRVVGIHTMMAGPDVGLAPASTARRDNRVLTTQALAGALER